MSPRNCQVIDSPEVLSVIDVLPHLRPFLSSLYACQYAQFFQARAVVVACGVAGRGYL